MRPQKTNKHSLIKRAKYRCKWYKQMRRTLRNLKMPISDQNIIFS
jgi:hypothetical protein